MANSSMFYEVPTKEHRNLKRAGGGETFVEGHREILNMLKSLSGNLEGQCHSGFCYH